MTQGFDLPNARLMIASALEDLAEALLEEGKPLPVPSDVAPNSEADLIELVPLSFTQAPFRSEAARIAGPPPSARMRSFPRRWSSFALLEHGDRGESSGAAPCRN